jgi:hypothetical protein
VLLRAVMVGPGTIGGVLEIVSLVLLIPGSLLALTGLALLVLSSETMVAVLNLPLFFSDDTYDKVRRVGVWLFCTGLPLAIAGYALAAVSGFTLTR